MSPIVFGGLNRKPENGQWKECNSIASVLAELLSMKWISVLLFLCLFGQAGWPLELVWTW
jgi:hypothetical protein